MAEIKRRAYRDETYWGKPVPGFGDSRAGLMIIGLAPAAHGGNRTGRVFTGDSSGTFLFRALHRAGFSSLPDSIHRDDGLALTGAYITAVVHCAPPDNKPLPDEIRNCRSYLIDEFQTLAQVRAVLALGRIAMDGFITALRETGRFNGRTSAFPFGHGKSYQLGPDLPRLFCSYHPSRQNTQTGRLTVAMFDRIFADVKRFLKSPR
ncbi:MAG TPA: uracil-DNA glycosylase [Nitrospiria bacterium]|nr:uracil-DNA glycosylase [Nitrospiria bacterium]